MPKGTKETEPAKRSCSWAFAFSKGLESHNVPIQRQTGRNTGYKFHMNKSVYLSVYLHAYICIYTRDHIPHTVGGGTEGLLKRGLSGPLDQSRNPPGPNMNLGMSSDSRRLSDGQCMSTGATRRRKSVTKAKKFFTEAVTNCADGGKGPCSLPPATMPSMSISVSFGIFLAVSWRCHGCPG